MLAACATVLDFQELRRGAADAGADAATASEDVANWYVSEKGDDGNDGSRSRPVRSVRRAVTLARDAAREGGPQKIAVCAGSYPESPLTLQGALEVRGGYDCTTWAREPADESPLLSREPSSRLVDTEVAEAFIVLEGDESGTPRLEGLSVRATMAAATIAARGEVVLADLSIANLTVPSDPRAELTAALLFRKAKARLEHSVLTVDRALTAPPKRPLAPEASSVGVGLSAFESDVVMKRTTVGVAYVVGICEGVLASESSLDIEESSFELLSCVTEADAPTNMLAAVGYAMNKATVKSVRNTILIDTPDHLGDGGVATVAGVNFAGANEKSFLDSDGDRIVGPTVVTATAGAFFGFSLGGRARIVNASIVLDHRNYRLEKSSGIVFSVPTDSVVQHNSIYLSARNADAGAMTTWAIDVPPEAIPGALTIESNLVVSDDPQAHFLNAAGCSGAGIARLGHNRYAGLPTPVRGFSGADGGCSYAELEIDGGAGDNLDVPCPAGACAKLFESTSQLDVRSAGLRPAADVGCDARLQVPRSANVTNDGAGSARGITTTAGAFDVPCK